jgi:uncharacterized membrane protein
MKTRAPCEPSFALARIAHMQMVVSWIVAALVFGAADAVWLSQAGPRIYRPLLGDMLRDKIAVAPAAAFYVIYISGLVFLAIAPALHKQSWSHAALAGAVLGFVAYATYDLSNQATLRAWDVRVTLVDMAWGAFASALAASAAYWVATRM